MAPDPATSKSRGSRYRSNEAHHNRAGEATERGSQRSETSKGKGEKDVAECGRGVKRRQHGGGGDVGSASGTHRSSKRWRGDGPEPLDTTIPIDRWDGGASDSPKESTFPVSKSSKQDSDLRSGGEGMTVKVANVQLAKEGGDAEKAVRKQKVTKASLAPDSRAITVMDLQETDMSVIDSNIRIKNKVSYRRESTSEFTEAEFEKVVEDNARSSVEASRTRRRWDRDGHKGGSDDAEDAHVRGNAGSEGSLERDKRKEKSSGRDRDRDPDGRIQNGRRVGEGSRDLSHEVDAIPEGSDELDHSNGENLIPYIASFVEFKIQEELRNIELEKELENRIRRRREESGDRDKWRDDDREREGKRHADDRTRDERHRSRRDRERHSDRYESRQHREESKLSDGRQREERHYESDREHRPHREDRYHRGRSNDLEDQGRSDRDHRTRDQDYRDRKSRENVSGYEAERRTRDKSHKDEPSERERSHPTSAYLESSEGTRSEHRHKRVRESDPGDGYGADRDQSRQRGRGAVGDSMTESEIVHDSRHRRSREDRDAEGRFERSQASPRNHDIMRVKSKGNSWRNDGPSSDLVSEGLPSPRHDARVSPSSKRMDYTSPQLDDQRSPRYPSQRSPSSHIDNSSVRGKAGHGDWFEHSNSVSTSSGPLRRTTGLGGPMGDRRDRLKWHAGAEEEVKSGMVRGSRPNDEGRDGSVSPHRLRDQHLSGAPGKPPLHGQDNYPRGMGGRGAMDERGDRGGWRGSLQGGSTAFDSGPFDHHGQDDLSPRDRNERVRRLAMNRPPGSPMLRSQGPQGPQMSALPVPPLAPLPPPPPFRPGIDNPAVLGPPNGGFDDASSSREQGRGDSRKGGPPRRGDAGVGIGPGEGWRGGNLGNWNSRNQGPLPGGGFPRFPHQFAPHPPGGFPGMGQQFHGPPMFPGGGGRPPIDMGFGGGRFLGPGAHMGDGGDGYLGPGRGSGWHGPGEDDGRGPPLLGPGDGWEGPGPHGDDRLRHGRMEWERGGPMGLRGWERDREREMWEGRGREAAPDFMPHRSQMEPLPQNPAFPPGGSGWGMPRDTQISNDVKPRQDRPCFDNLEVKRKPDGGPPKMKTAKPSSQGVSLSEGRLSKYAAANMQSILAQIDISPDLAGPELYAQYLALLPPSEAAKRRARDEEENTKTSPWKDDDLILEGDADAEELIAGPDLLAKILPPLPDGAFEEAVRLYRKPETENRVRKSLRGSFVLPFDPSTITLSTISLKLNRNAGTTQCPITGVGSLLSQLDVDTLDIELKEFLKPIDEKVNNVEESHEPVHLEDREGEATGDEFVSSHVEVAEYSDREFEAEMEDTLEEYSLKEVQGDGPLLDRSEATGEIRDSRENVAVDKEAESTETLVKSIAEIDHTCSKISNDLQIKDVLDIENELAKLGNLEDYVSIGADTGENVNSFVVSKDANDYGATVEVDEVEDERRVLIETREFTSTSGNLTALIEAKYVQASTQVVEELAGEVSVLNVGKEVTGDFLEIVEANQSMEAEGIKEALAVVEVFELKNSEEVGAVLSVDIEGNGFELNEEPPEASGIADVQNCVSDDILSTPVLELDVQKETNGKLKEPMESPAIKQSPGGNEQPQPEPLPRLRKRRASSRLQAQSIEAQAAAQKEAVDGLDGEGSVVVNKVGTRGITRSSQRRAKRRGSTH